MKKTYTILVFAIISTFVIAQVPQKISYQVIIRNSSNALVTGQTVGMRISILQGSATGTEVYAEKYNPEPKTNGNGLVSIEIGSGVPQTGTFEAINWGGGPYFIKTETDPTGGTNYTITGTTQLLSVPYALYAKKAENGFSGIYGDLSNKPTNIDEDKTNDVTLAGAQTIAGNKTFTGTTTVATPVNASDAATKSYVDALLTQLSAKGAIAADIDGNIYSTVRIGSQVWMAENLKTTKYRDGTPIPNVTGVSTWIALTTGAYADYNNIVNNSNTYGKLYNYYAVIDYRKLCPTGWHVPSDDEWTTLTTFIGGLSVAGGKLKEKGTSHWFTPNTGAENSVGFTALPGGFRSNDGGYYGLGGNAYFWSTTEYNSTTAIFRFILYSTINMTQGNGYKVEGSSVRCLKD